MFRDFGTAGIVRWLEDRAQEFADSRPPAKGGFRHSRSPLDFRLTRCGLPMKEALMSDFDFDVVTGPSGPVRRGRTPSRWKSAEAPPERSAPAPTPVSAAPAALPASAQADSALAASG
jgi:hypothetical protein